MIIDDLLREWEENGEIANVTRKNLFKTEYNSTNYSSNNYSLKNNSKSSVKNYIKLKVVV